MSNYLVTKSNVFIGTPDEFSQFGEDGQVFVDSTKLDKTSIELLAGKRMAPTIVKHEYITQSDDGLNSSVIPVTVKSNPQTEKVVATKVARMIQNGVKQSVPNNKNVGKQKQKKGKNRGVSEVVRQKGDPYEVAEHLLRITDGSVLESLGIEGHRVEEFEPQRYIDEVSILPDLNNLSMVAFKIVNSAYQRGIINDKFLQPPLPAALISYPYLAYLAICSDLYGALINELSIFKDMPIWYWYMRNALTPRVWGGRRAYSWNLSTLPDMETWVLSLGPTTWYANDFGLAVPTGTEDADGYMLLDAGATTNWTLELIQSLGRGVVSTMVTDMCFNQSEVQLGPDLLNITPTVAAFCERYITPDAANDTVGVVTAKDKLQPHHLWLSELGIASVTGSISIGKYHYTAHSGSVVWGYIVQFGLNPWDNIVYKIKVKQVSAAQIVSEMLTMFLQADLMSQDILPHGNVAQTPASLMLAIGAADFIQYAMAFLTKRYSQYNAAYFGSPLPQSSFYLAGGSDQTYMPLDALNFSLPTQVVEDLARLVTFELPSSKNGRVVEVRLPVLVGYFGRDFNANPLDVSGPSMSLTSALVQMYPNVSFPSWVFGASYSSKYPLTLAATVYSKFIGSTPSISRRQIGSDLAWFNQYFPITPSNANIEEVDETMLYYTLICEPYTGQITTFDCTMQLQAHSMVNKYAFDPRHTLQDIRVMPIAVFPLDLLSEYTTSYDEVKSLDMNTSVATISMLIENTIHNKFNGYPGEQAEVTRSSIVQGLGGGFILKLGRIAGRVIKSIPSIFSAISGAFNDGQPMVPDGYLHRCCRQVLRQSGNNPYAAMLRLKPVSDTGSVIVGHRLRA